jgi:hypothetical protein
MECIEEALVAITPIVRDITCNYLQGVKHDRSIADYDVTCVRYASLITRHDKARSFLGKRSPCADSHVNVPPLPYQQIGLAYRVYVYDFYCCV